MERLWIVTERRKKGRSGEKKNVGPMQQLEKEVNRKEGKQKRRERGDEIKRGKKRRGKRREV